MAKIMIMVNEQEEHVKVGRLKVGQLKEALKKIQEVISTVQGGEGTGDLISYFLEMDKNKKEEGAAPVDDAFEDTIFMEKVLSAAMILFNKIPDDMTELISILSGIDEKIIDDQEIEVLLDIIETIVKENDIRALTDRVKSSFLTVRQKWGGLKAIKG